MKIPWKVVLGVGSTVLDQIIPGVAVVEAIARRLGGLHGAQKQDAVVELVKAALETAHGVTGKELANDADVEKATRGVIDAVVALHNITAKKTAAAV